MVAVEVERAVFYSVLVEHFLYHLFFLLQVEYLNTGLDDSAAMLIRWVFENMSLDIAEYDIQVFLSNSFDLLHFLNHIVSETVQNQLLKSYAGVL